MAVSTTESLFSNTTLQFEIGIFWFLNMFIFCPSYSSTFCPSDNLEAFSYNSRFEYISSNKLISCLVFLLFVLLLLIIIFNLYLVYDYSNT